MINHFLLNSANNINIQIVFFVSLCLGIIKHKISAWRSVTWILPQIWLIPNSICVCEAQKWTLTIFVLKSSPAIHSIAEMFAVLKGDHNIVRATIKQRYDVHEFFVSNINVTLWHCWWLLPYQYYSCITASY